MKSEESPAAFNGYYSTEYAQLVEPRKIWSCSKYFLRRWGPILEPNRFWTVIAARHLSYLNNSRSTFQAFDKRMAQEIHVSRRQVIRLKQEMLEESPLSVFLTRKPTRRAKNGGLIKTEITDYAIRLDTPLTPADALDVSRWIQAELRGKGRERIEDQLRLIIDSGDPSLLIPAVQARIEKNLVTWKGHTVSQLFNHAKLNAYQEAGDQIHQVLTGSSFVSTQYFRGQWVPILGAGAAFLISWLRSYCYAQDSEVRNELTLEKSHIAEQLQISVKNLSRYMTLLEKYGFITETGRRQTAEKKRLYTFQINLLEPLTPTDLSIYRQRIADRQNVTNRKEGHHASSGQFGTKEDLLPFAPDGQNVTNSLTKPLSILSGQPADESFPKPNGQDVAKERLLDSHGQFVTNAENGDFSLNRQDVTKKPKQADKLTQPIRQNVTGKRTDWPAFNSFKLLQSIQEKNSYQEWMDGWNLQAVQLPFHLAIGGEGGNKRLLEMIGLNLESDTAQSLLDLKLSSVDLVGTWLQINHDRSDTITNPTGLFAYRMKQGQRAKPIYLEAAQIKWGTWITCMILSQRPDLQIEYYDIVRSHEFKIWSSLYQAGPWPFALKGQIGPWLDLLGPADPIFKDEPRSKSQAPLIDVVNHKQMGQETEIEIWTAAKVVLKRHMGEMFDIFLADSEVIALDENEVVLKVKDATALAYLQSEWLPLITQTLAKLTNLDRIVRLFTSPSSSDLGRGVEIDQPDQVSAVSIEDKWEQVLAELELAVRPALFQRVFKGSRAASSEESGWTIELKDERAAELAQTRLHRIAYEYMSQLVDEPPQQLKFVARTTGQSSAVWEK